MIQKLRKNSVSLLAILMMLILMAIPTGYEDAVIYKGTDRVRAKVLSTDESTVTDHGLMRKKQKLEICSAVLWSLTKFLQREILPR